MHNVDRPINVLNDLADKKGSQRVHIQNFYIHNSGGMTDASGEKLSSRIEGIATGYFPKAGKIYYGGLVNSTGGYWVIVEKGKYYNDLDYGGIDNIVSGWGESSKIAQVDYKLRFNCKLHESFAGCD
jgi:hypothetical protein